MKKITLILIGSLYGCIQHNINMSTGRGDHDLGPADDRIIETSKDTQSSSDSIKELSSKISGVDKSQNEIKRSIDKTSRTQQQMEDRNEAIDRLNPDLPRHQRRQMYKDEVPDPKTD